MYINSPHKREKKKTTYFFLSMSNYQNETIPKQKRAIRTCHGHICDFDGSKQKIKKAVCTGYLIHRSFLKAKKKKFSKKKGG